MSQLAEKAPKKIMVPFEYENHVKTAHYSLRTPDIAIERVELSGIYTALDGFNEHEQRDSLVTYWIPYQYGWYAGWILSGDEFMKRAVLEEIKDRK